MSYSHNGPRVEYAINGTYAKLRKQTLTVADYIAEIDLADLINQQQTPP